MNIDYLKHLVPYVERACSFAFIIVAIWGLFSVAFWLKSKKPFPKQDFAIVLLIKPLYVFYLASLFQITVIRKWEDFFHFANKELSLQSIQYIPFKTSLWALSMGTSSFIFHVLGNMACFIPLGFLSPFVFKNGIFQNDKQSNARALSKANTQAHFKNKFQTNSPQILQKTLSVKNIAMLGASVSFSIEFLQWLFHSGVFDIDDIILNTLGTLLGYGLLLGCKKYF